MAIEIVNIVVSKATCEHCGYSWIVKTANPRACPRCKQYLNKVNKKQMPVKEGC